MISMERNMLGQKNDASAKRRCHRCRGSGRAPCQICNGAGQMLKGKDHLGKPKFDRCDGCFGMKTTRCAVCNGEGMI